MPLLAEYTVLNFFSPCPGKQSLPWNFPLYWTYFLPFRIFEKLALATNTEFALKIFTVLNILLHSGFLSNLPLPWKTKCALNSLYWIYIFHHSGFLSDLRLPWKTELPWNFSLYWNIFIIQDFWATCACPENRFCPEFTVLNTNFLTFRIFEQLALAQKNRSCPEMFHCIEIFFIQDFWATCACTENRVCPEFAVLNIYFLSFRIFEQLALALKNMRCPDIFHCIEIFLSFRIFEQLALALKTEFALNSLYWIYIFYHSGFLSNFRLPWNFSGRGGGRPPASYAYDSDQPLWKGCHGHHDLVRSRLSCGGWLLLQISWILPIQDKTTKATVEHAKSVCARHGIPVEIVSDNMPFRSKEILDFTQAWGIKATTSSTTFFQSNGQAERFVQTLKRMLTKHTLTDVIPILHFWTTETPPYQVFLTLQHRCSWADAFAARFRQRLSSLCHRLWMLICRYSTDNNAKSSTTTAAPSLCYVSNKVMDYSTNNTISERKQLSFNVAHNVGHTGYKLNTASLVAIGNTCNNLCETPV